jgi:hypothetical protein
MPGTIASLLATLPAARRPRQDSTNAQLADVETLLQAHGYASATDTEKALVANRLGMYDAADRLRHRGANLKATTPP